MVSLTMTLFSEKMLIFTRCIHGFMSNLIKKSWTDSKCVIPKKGNGFSLQLKSHKDKVQKVEGGIVIEIGIKSCYIWSTILRFDCSNI